MGSGVLSTGTRRGYAARRGSTGCVGISPFSSHVSESLLRFTSNAAAGTLLMTPQ